MAVGPEHGESASVTDRQTDRHTPPHHCTCCSLAQDPSRISPPSLTTGCPAASTLVSQSQRKSPFKLSGLSGCSCISSFLFTARSLKGLFVPTIAGPSASQGCQDVSHRPGSPALAPPFPVHLSSPCSGHSRSPGTLSSASASLPVGLPFPALPCHSLPFHVCPSSSS